MRQNGRKSMFEVPLTEGPERRALYLFSIPFILGNLLQQCYNVADTWVVGRYVGARGLAAVGASFALMVLLTSILIGLCMGAQIKIAQLFGAGAGDELAACLAHAILIVGSIAILLTGLPFLLLDPLLRLMAIDAVIWEDTRRYLEICFTGIPFIAVYNYCAAVMRARGNSAMPVLVTLFSTLLNIGLDLYFVIGLDGGVAGAAWATVIAQALAAALVLFFSRRSFSTIRRRHFIPQAGLMKELLQLSVLTGLQQSIMNFGILMVQRLVNSFGFAVTAAFAAGVKIDAFAYMPVQDYGNAFSVFVSQNYGARKGERLHRGYRIAMRTAAVFSLIVSALVFVFAPDLIRIFVDAGETRIIEIGVTYLRIEGSFYIGIAFLFIYYGLFRGLGDAGTSIFLTILSLGLRVALAYLFAPLAMEAIWWSIPIGWIIADIVGTLLWLKRKKSLLLPGI